MNDLLVNEPPIPSPPPRAMNPRALKRSWQERPVRLWIILTLIITVTTIYFAVRDIGGAMTERRLIYHGQTISARIDMIDEYDMKQREFERSEPHDVFVRYSTPQGRLILKQLAMPAGGTGTIRVGDMIDVRVAPDDLETATLQTEPRSWAAALAVFCLLAPLSILMALVMFLQRKRVQRIWREGDAARAIVVDSHRSGIAPRSKIVRFSLAEYDDNRVFSTLYPHSAGELEPGDEFWVVIPTGSPARAIVAELYT